jgi:hypothetical protein
MNTLARLVSAVAVLATTLVFSGCSTTTARKPRLEVVSEFAVVESSTEQELTTAQMDELRKAVINYLQEQGLSGSRIYYVKVTFPTTRPDEQPQWAVVRIGNVPSRTYTVLAAYPGPDDYFPYDVYHTGYHHTGYRTGYFPGYAGFSRWGYYDPFDYNYGGYSGHPRPPRDHPKPDKPDDKPTDKPAPPPNRWEVPNRPNPENPRRGVYPPRPSTPTRWNRETPDRDGGPRSLPPRGSSGERSYTPPSERSHTPQPERSYTPPERSYSPPSPPPEPVRSDPPAQHREDDNRQIQQH